MIYKSYNTTIIRTRKCRYQRQCYRSCIYWYLIGSTHSQSRSTHTTTAKWYCHTTSSWIDCITVFIYEYIKRKCTTNNRKYRISTCNRRSENISLIIDKGTCYTTIPSAKRIWNYCKVRIITIEIILIYTEWANTSHTSPCIWQTTIQRIIC